MYEILNELVNTLGSHFTDKPLRDAATEVSTGHHDDGGANYLSVLDNGIELEGTHDCHGV